METRVTPDPRVPPSAHGEDMQTTTSSPTTHPTGAPHLPQPPRAPHQPGTPGAGTQGGTTPPNPYGPRPYAGSTASAPRRSRLPSAAEGLGWAGAVTTLLGVLALTADSWTRLPSIGLVGILAVASAVLALGGAAVGRLVDEDADDGLAANLATGLWWSAALATIVTCGVAGDRIGDGDVWLGSLAASLAASAIAGARAVRTGADRFLAATVLCGAVAAFSAGGVAGLQGSTHTAALGAIGLAAAAALVVLGDGWRLTYGISVLLITPWAGSVLLTDGPAGLVLAVGTALVALTVGAVLRRSAGEAVLTGLVSGTYAIAVAHDQAPELFNLPALVTVSGVAMVLGCVALVRRS